MRKFARAMMLAIVTVGIMFAATATVTATDVCKQHTAKELSEVERNAVSNIMANVRGARKEEVRLTYHLNEMALSRVVRVVNDTYFRYYGRVHYTANRQPNGDIRVRLYAKKSKSDFLRSEKNKRKLAEIAKRETRGKASERAKVLALNDYVCRKLSYGYNQGTLDIALWGNVSKCTGYALLFQGLCDALGIPCCTVAGEAGPQRECHCWCRVKVSKLWYYIDPTWNDGTGNKYTLSRKLWSDHEEWTRVYTIDLTAAGYA